MSRTPQGSDLLLLTTCLKPLLLKYQRDKGFEVVGLRITLTSLPGTYCMSRDVEDISQFCLSRSGCRSQVQHLLTEVVVLLSIRRFRHRPFPYPTTQPGQPCKVRWQPMDSAFLGGSSILVSVGRASSWVALVSEVKKRR